MVVHLILCAILSVVSCIAIAATPERPILVLGDSLSAAHGLAPSEGWVALLDARLRSAGTPHTIVNASISGETTAGGLARLPALLAQHKPALVMIELGANDGLRGLPIAEIRANLVKILDAVRGADAHGFLIGIELPVNYGPRYRDDLRALYRGLATEYNAPLVPFLLDGVALDPALMQADGLHPNAAGERKVLDNVWPTLERVLRKELESRISQSDEAKR
ncbi:MAG: arylesterase [Rhodanobacter sp.]|jgi:acyl-CoA thioesterase-1|nr:arylesterase [Rhodanobacter sp.]